MIALSVRRRPVFMLEQQLPHALKICSQIGLTN